MLWTLDNWRRKRSQNHYHKEDEVRPVLINNQLQTYLRAWEIRRATRKKSQSYKCKYTTWIQSRVTEKLQGLT